MGDLSHFDASGASRMVDVGEKPLSERSAVASGRVRMSADTLTRIRDQATPKGDVLEVARLAGIMAAKRTADLIPLCHPLQLTHVDIQLNADEIKQTVHCIVEVKTDGKTGVEMEALTAVQITLLTIYDMCKAMDRGMSMSDISLVKKSGGKSGDWLK
jgi:cyclic pyranopterin phosphate synthase